MSTAPEEPPASVDSPMRQYLDAPARPRDKLLGALIGLTLALLCLGIAYWAFG